MFTLNIKNEGKCVVCDFNHRMVVNTRWAGLNISETADPLVFYTQQSLGCKQNCANKNKQNKNIL